MRGQFPSFVRLTENRWWNNLPSNSHSCIFIMKLQEPNQLYKGKSWIAKSCFHLYLAHMLIYVINPLFPADTYLQIMFLQYTLVKSLQNENMSRTSP